MKSWQAKKLYLWICPEYDAPTNTGDLKNGGKKLKTYEVGYGLNKSS